MLTGYLKLGESGARFRTEVLAGVTTFATMAYIIFVQPAVLGAAGMDQGAVFTSTCIVTALATALMALLANYPVAVAPAMGHNFFFAYVVVLTMKVPWQVALGAVFLSGVIFVATSSFGLRERLVHAVPESLKCSIAAGIGLLITLIGLEWAGLVRLDPNTFVTLGHLDQKPTVVALVGLLATIVMMARGLKGSILIGILIAALLAFALGVVKAPTAIVSLPPSMSPTAFKLDVIGAIQQGLFAIIFIFFFLDLFDTVGSLIGIAKQADLMKDGELPRVGRALLADAIGTVGSSLAGNTTMVSYIESSAGVAAGGRTGIAALVTAALFLIALLFSPLVGAISGGVPTQEVIHFGTQQVSHSFVLYPITSPALIVVGSLMVKALREIQWQDVTESIPAYLTMVLIPLTFSITDGMAVGFISYALLKLVTGRGKEVHWLIYLFAGLFVIRYAVPSLH